MWSFLPICLLNLLMLSSVPAAGDHYLIDVIGGSVLAFPAFWVARGLCRDRLVHDSRSSVCAL
jgi:membrane-associated phospholipid phosphatase